MQDKITGMYFWKANKRLLVNGSCQNESFDGESLDRTTKLLAGISGRVGKAVQSAMPRAILHLRRQSSKRILK